MKYYEVVAKDLELDGWETIATTKTLKQAMEIAQENEKKYGYEWIDINLIIDNNLVETYDMKGVIR